MQRRVQDVISPIVFEAAYSLGEHITGDEERELPALTPVLRWKKGQKIAQKNQVRTCVPMADTQRDWDPMEQGWWPNVRAYRHLLLSCKMAYRVVFMIGFDH